MNWEKGIWKGLVTEEPFPGQPIAEIAGTQRILIENHRGILEYSEGRIRTAVAFGSITVCGTGLELSRMTSQQLLIRGSIQSVHLTREEG